MNQIWLFFTSVNVLQCILRQEKKKKSFCVCVCMRAHVFLIPLLCHLFVLRVKNYDKMKNEDSSSPFEAFHSILIFVMLLFIQELSLKKKGPRERQKEHCNLPSYLKEQSLFMASWVILIYN